MKLFVLCRNCVGDPWILHLEAIWSSNILTAIDLYKVTYDRYHCVFLNSEDIYVTEVDPPTGVTGIFGYEYRSEVLAKIQPNCIWFRVVDI